jgi:hypothetical protein
MFLAFLFLLLNHVAAYHGILVKVQTFYPLLQICKSKTVLIQNNIANHQYRNRFIFCSFAYEAAASTNAAAQNTLSLG